MWAWRCQFYSPPSLSTVKVHTWGGSRPYLHAAVVYDHCLKLDFGVQFSNFLTALQEQPIPKFPVHGPKETDSVKRVQDTTFPGTYPTQSYVPHMMLALWTAVTLFRPFLVA